MSLYFILARDLEYGDPATLAEASEEISKMLDGYMRALLPRL